LWLWHALPNGRRAYFYNLWAGRAADRRADLAQVLALLAQGRLTAPVGAEFPLVKAAEAMRAAESGTIAGKVILTGS
jgi:NADPH:quinone reductase-like Zn-dependent oxidoreductase